MIEVSNYLVIVYTNYSAISSIVKQIKLISSSIDQLNLRLIRVFTYLSQFQLIIRHKSDKNHVIFDALLRLSTNNNLKIEDESILNVHQNKIHHDEIEVHSIQYAYSEETKVYDESAIVEILVAISSDFKRQLLQEYRRDTE